MKRYVTFFRFLLSHCHCRSDGVAELLRSQSTQSHRATWRSLGKHCAQQRSSTASEFMISVIPRRASASVMASLCRSSGDCSAQPTADNKPLCACRGRCRCLDDWASHFSLRVCELGENLFYRIEVRAVGRIPVPAMGTALQSKTALS